MAKALMIQGTGSGAGKSMAVTALCRIFRDLGFQVSPFKSQNMALNSYITVDGGEIGMAQALQAEAAGIKATTDMNPILLKTSGEEGSQIIIQGRVHYTMKKEGEYYAFRKTAWKAVEESYRRLSEKHELIFIEGAGNPAEINLMKVDIANMAIAKLAGAPVVLIGDIDKGGVFASFYGTIKLLGRDSRYIKGYIINKFHGDMEILKPGLVMIEDKTGKPVIGVLPYVFKIGLPEEDGLSLYQKSDISQNDFQSRQKSEVSMIKIVVVKLKYISNFTDYDPFSYEPDVEIVYSQNPMEIENADIVIIPGSKNSVKDLMFLKENQLDESIKRAYSKGIQIIGICGGYQMLSKRIHDPYGVESLYKEVEGIGLLNIETSFEKEKKTYQVKAELSDGVFDRSLMGNHLAFDNLRGYEIHMGVSTGDIGLFKVNRLSSSEASHIIGSELVLDGTKNSNCWGTYLHGIFENDEFRRGIINQVRKNKGLSSLKNTVKYTEVKEGAIDNFANIFRENIDIDFIKRILKL